MLEPPNKDDVQYINFQVFPASYENKTTGARKGNELKVICTDKYFIVYSDKDVVEFISELVAFEKHSYKHFSVQTKDGDFEVYRENNCGCGNQLRGFHPYVGKGTISQYPFLKGT